MIAKGFSKCSPRCERIRTELVQAIPSIEVDRAVYLTESYKQTENEPHVIRRAKALENVLAHLPVVIRNDELIVGTLTKNVRSCQLYPEFSYEWVVAEFDTIAHRLADQFVISEEDKKTLREVLPYWKNKTVSDAALAYMTQETKDCMANGVFTVGNYLYGGVGHVIINYDKAIRVGYNNIMKEIAYNLETADKLDPDYIEKSQFWKAALITLNAGIQWAKRYAAEARRQASSCPDPARKAELLQIAANCEKVPAEGATNFWEACQSFMFTQMILQCESSGHSVSPGRFDQYMYPFLKNDTISKDEAQEILDCVFLKLNDLNKVRDDISSQGFAGYQVFQNINAGGQTKDGLDATNELSYMMIDTVARIRMNAPSFSVRIWNGTPDEFLLRCCELCRLGLGLPAMYNDECIIPALTNRGISLHDARDYGLIGCVEPEPQGLEYGWHDSAFVNAAKILEITINNGKNGNVQLGPVTGDVSSFKSIDDFYEAFTKQMEYFVYHVVQADNCVDLAHRERAQLPFLSCFVYDCIGKGKDVNQGGAKYNFTGPQYFGVGDVGDSVYSIQKHVFDQKDFTFAELKDALDANFGYPTTAASAASVSVSNNTTHGSVSEKQLEDVISRVLGEILGKSTSSSVSAAAPAISHSRYEDILHIIESDTEWFGNDIDSVDLVTRKCAQIYCYELEKYYNPRGGQFQAGIYPVSANVLFGKDVGAMADGRLAYTPLGDGCSPRAGKDTLGPTAAANSVAKLDHEVASNGTLYNQKFTPQSVAGDQGLINFAAMVRSYFDKKGMHIQFNVVDKETLLDAQVHPENYKDLVVRVAGYSAMFTSLAREVQDNIIARTEQQL
ncbi:MAG: glycyl radical protein [Eubacterium sp.]|nr:glycyl radical protein [Eubacterium sp.]